MRLQLLAVLLTGNRRGCAADVDVAVDGDGDDVGSTTRHRNYNGPTVRFFSFLTCLAEQLLLLLLLLDAVCGARRCHRIRRGVWLCGRRF